MNCSKIFIFIFLIITFLSCKKKELQPDNSTHLKNGLLVLNEGLFQLNNSSLSWIDLSSNQVDNQIFEKKSGRQLGDTGNDILRYGSKIYIVVNVSSTVEILDANTLSPIKQLSIVKNGVAQQPRFMTALGKNIYLSNFGGEVWAIDTTSLDVTNKIPVGLNPDPITNDGQNVYVSNSGGLNATTYDSTVSVINGNTNTEIKKIVVGKNPGKIVLGGNGFIYVIVRGNYTNIPVKICRINPQTLEVDKTYSLNATQMIPYDAEHLILGLQQADGKQILAKFNLNTEQVEQQNLIDVSGITTLYNVQFSMKEQKFYVFDSKNYSETGKVNVYSNSGAFINSFSVGLNPSKLLIFK